MVNKSLANRVTIVILLVIVGITLVFNLARAYFDFQTELSGNIDRLSQAATYSGPLMAEAIYQERIDTISRIAEGLMLHKAVEALIVEDANGKVLFERAVREPLVKAPLVSFFLPDAPVEQSFTLFDSPEALGRQAQMRGRLHLSINHQRGLSGFVERSRQLFWIGLFRTFLTLIVLVVGLRYLLVLPLRKVVSDLQSVSVEDSELIVPKGHQSDEIGLLVQKINESLGRQRQQMTEIEENEQRLKSILDGAGDACVLFAQGEGEIVYANDAATELLGYGHEELLTLRVFDINPSLDRTEWFERVRIVSRIRSHQRESILISKNGDEIPVESTSSSIDLEGRRLLLSFIRDMSARKRLELNLAHAQKLTSLGELTGGVAHDFNNLLQLIQGALDTVKGASDLKSPEVQSSLKIADRASEQGADLVGQLLAFSKKQDLDPKLINLFDTISRNLSLLEQAAGEGVSISFESNLKTLWTRLDSTALNSALLNLVVNARHAMPQGGNLRLILSAASTSEVASYLPNELKGKQVALLSVSDDGEGMSEAVAQRVFEPFYTTKSQGTGMGLAMVFGFVAQSGGHVRVDSREGVGTTFFIYLPVTGEVDLAGASRREIEGSNDRSSYVESRGAVGAAAGGGGHHQTTLPAKKSQVLIVDDHDDVRFLTKNFLEAEGYSTTDVASPAEALGVLADQNEPIGLVITDLKMPEQQDGLDFIERCQREYPEVGLAVISGDLRELSRAGGNLPENVAVLSKPFTRPKLAALLQDFTENIDKPL